MLRENCFEMWSQMLTENILKVHKTIFRKKVQKLKKNKKKNNENNYNLWRILGTKLLLLVYFWDQCWKTVFSKDFFCFLLLTPKCLESCVKCVTKCVTSKIYPMKVRILQQKNQSNFTYNLIHHITKTGFSKYFFWFLL